MQLQSNEDTELSVPTQGELFHWFMQNKKSMLTDLQLHNSYLPFRVNNVTTILLHFLHCNATTTIHTSDPHTATKIFAAV